MDELTKELTKPIWWISVVVAGVAVNLISAYLKPRIDGILLRSSSWWRARSQARIAQYENMIDEHRSPDRQVATFAKSMLAGIYGLFFTLAAIFFYLALIESEIGKGRPKVEATGFDVVTMFFVLGGIVFALVALDEFKDGLNTIQRAAESNSQNIEKTPPHD